MRILPLLLLMLIQPGTGLELRPVSTKASQPRRMHEWKQLSKYAHGSAAQVTLHVYTLVDHLEVYLTEAGSTQAKFTTKSIHLESKRVETRS